MKKLCLFLCFCLLCPMLTACGAESELTRYEVSFLDVFDTYSRIVLYAPDQQTAQTIVDDAHAELVRYHQLYDIYNEYDGIHNLKTLNDRAAAEPVVVDSRILALIAYAKEMHEKTGGRMNIAMGSVLRLWHDSRTEGLSDPDNARIPDVDALREAAEHTDINDIIVDEAASTVFFADPELRLDVGAIAKGYAVERVAQTMMESGIAHALLSIGGNVRAIGARADGTAWRVGVQNPDLSAEEQTLCLLDLADASLVSSGSYQRYYTVDGKIYHHIIDPDTLLPAEQLWAVTVVTEDSGLADALSTALYTLSVTDGQALLAAFPEVDALWVLHDGTQITSDGFTAHIAAE